MMIMSAIVLPTDQNMVPLADQVQSRPKNQMMTCVNCNAEIRATNIIVHLRLWKGCAEKMAEPCPECDNLVGLGEWRATFAAALNAVRYPG
jgi:hypothetical protein